MLELTEVGQLDVELLGKLNITEVGILRSGSGLRPL